MKEKLDKILGTSIAILMGLMVVNVTWQVASRYIFGDPSSWTDEVARYLLVWLGLLGAAYVSGKNGHLAIDILPSKLKGKQAQLLQYFIHGVIILFAAVVMVAGGGNLVYITEILDQRTATLQVPLSWIYLMIPISGLIVIIYHSMFFLSIKTKFA